MLIKDIPINERPIERLIKYGVGNLSNEELLSIIIKTGTINKSVKDISLEILKKIDDINDLKDISYNKLLSINGIGKSKACQILSSIELGKRVFFKNNLEKIKLNNSNIIFENMKSLFLESKQEYFYCLYLNNKCELIERKLLFMGTINRSIVHPREVFKYAYLTSAYSIICVHNHPSGDINPSKEDINFTKALIEIGDIQNIPIVDHIIIGNENYYSMRDNLDIFNI